MDVYVVVDGARVVGVSARLQGAELIRADHARRVADANWPDDPDAEAAVYDRLRVENHNVRDMEN